jgi:3-phosphoshikimate 1-carboxyvinyltransferase
VVGGKRLKLTGSHMPQKSRQTKKTADGAEGSRAALAAKLALLIAAVAPGESRIAGLPAAVGCGAVVKALAAFGAGSTVIDDARLVTGIGNGCLLEPDGALDLGEDPEAVCLVAGLAGAYDMRTRIACDWPAVGMDAAGAIAGLQRMGVQAALPGNGTDELVIAGPRVTNPVDWGAHPVSAVAAAAMLLAALNTPGLTTVACDADTGRAIAGVFEAFGCAVTAEEEGGAMRISIAGQRQLAAADFDLGATGN